MRTHLHMDISLQEGPPRRREEGCDPTSMRERGLERLQTAEGATQPRCDRGLVAPRGGPASLVPPVSRDETRRLNPQDISEDLVRPVVDAIGIIASTAGTDIGRVGSSC